MDQRIPAKSASAAKQRSTSGRRRGRPTRRNGANRTLIGCYLSEIGGSPNLTLEEETRLAHEIQEGRRDSLNRLVEANLRFVVKIAKEYRNCGLPFEDLISEGNLGMITAAKRFVPGRGARFVTWAAWWIRKSIRSALADQPQIVRLPLSQLSRMQIVRDTERDLQDDIGREPTPDELAAQLPKNLAGLDPIHRFGIRYTSLDHRPDDEASDRPQEWLEDKSVVSAERAIIEREAVKNLSALYERLDDQQRAVLACRYGLDGREPMTLRATGRHIGRSGEGIRLIESRAIERLRKMFAARALPFRRPVRARPSDTGRRFRRQQSPPRLTATGS